MNNQESQTKQILRRHRALAILRFLARSPEYRSNENVVMDWFRHLALTCTRAEFRELASFLEREGLVRSENGEGIQVLTLMGKGLEFAQGRDFSEDIERPGPECAY